MNTSPVIELRRDMHRHPELGFLEYRTASRAAEKLSALGWGVRVGPEVMLASEMLGAPSAEAVSLARKSALETGAPAEWIDRMPGGQTGVVAELTRGAGPILALRFDMDALPVAETDAAAHRPNEGGFRSVTSGQMHACGHDGHTAIGLALAEQLAHPAAGWHGTVRLIFQPAEEGGRGAWPMVQSGLLDDVDWFFAGHLGCFLPSGEVAAEATGFLYSTKIDVSFHGRAAHAAMGPQDGRNALLAGATATLGLYGISRHGQDSTLVNVGKMIAGSGRNIIADECFMMIEVRGSTEASLTYMEGRAQEILAAAAAMHGCTFETKVMGKSAGIVQSPEAVARVAAVARTVSGINRVHDGWSIGGGDDATFMMKRVQDRGGKAAYFLIGSDIPAVHHAVNFDIDETSLEHGVSLFAGLVQSVLGERS
jgi:aminobenzoyl-glutamate utilization protein A